MGLFRKRETYNEQMLREAGLDRVVFNEPEPPSLEPPPFPRGEFSRSRPEWDAVVSVRDSALAGDRIDFTTLPNGDVIVETEEGDGDISSLADAVEEKLSPPYRAAATRHGIDLWAVGAKRIQVVQIELAEGDAIELTENDGVRELRVDDEPSDAAVPALESLGRQAGSDYCVEARRIDGDSWEVKVRPL